MEQAWRWFGPKDPIALAHVREAGATGIVTALHQIPGGTAWDDAAIAERKAMIESRRPRAGRWSRASRSPTPSRRRPPSWRHDVDAWKATLARPRPRRHRDGLLQLHADRRLDAHRPRLAAEVGPGAPLRPRRLRRLRRLRPAAAGRRRRLRRRRRSPPREARFATMPDARQRGARADHPRRPPRLGFRL